MLNENSVEGFIWLIPLIMTISIILVLSVHTRSTTLSDTFNGHQHKPLLQQTRADTILSN